MEETKLCELAYKYGTDKCPRIKHVYTPFYYELFKDRTEEVKKVLELGIGYWKTMKHVDEVFDKNLNRTYKKGASLKMWRDFFPNAIVYGTDIAPDAMFTDERIETFVVDERSGAEMNALLDNIGTDIDIVIDDADHYWKTQALACQILMPRLPDDVTYIIEDVGASRALAKALSDYDCEVPELPGRTQYDGKLVVVRKKK